MKVGYYAKPINQPYLYGVIHTGNLMNDLSDTLYSFMGEHQTTYMTDVTRSKIRLEMTKVVEKAIVCGTRNDHDYTIRSNSGNNVPETIEQHKLFAILLDREHRLQFTLEGNQVNV